MGSSTQAATWCNLRLVEWFCRRWDFVIFGGVRGVLESITGCCKAWRTRHPASLSCPTSA